MKLCEKCEIEPRIERERFCPKCKEVVMSELRKSGFMLPLKMQGNRRTGSMKQAFEGDGSPWGENAVRALEDAR